jgi:hypothetical protein
MPNWTTEQVKVVMVIAEYTLLPFALYIIKILIKNSRDKIKEMIQANSDILKMEMMDHFSTIIEAQEKRERLIVHKLRNMQTVVKNIKPESFI